MLDDLKKEKNTIDPEKFVCAKFDGTIFNFNAFKNYSDFASDIYHNGKTSLKDAKKPQYKMFCLLNDLKEYNPKNLEKVKSRDETLLNAERMYNNRNNIIKGGVFPFKDRFQKKNS